MAASYSEEQKLLEASMQRAQRLLDMLLAHLEQDVRQHLPMETKARAELAAIKRKSRIKIVQGDEEEFDPSVWLWGEKESAVSVLTKLSQLLIKLKEADANPDADADAAGVQPLSDGDWNILERYVQKRQQETALRQGD